MSIINLNVNELTSPLKRHGIAIIIIIIITKLYAAYKKTTSALRTNRLRVKGEKDILASGNQKKAGIATLTSDKN